MAAEAGDGALFTQTLVFLGAAVVAVPLFKRIGLGSVLGYLAAGLFLGPVFQFITGAEDILHFAEFGVVLLLFVIGLELKPSRLWTMRHDIFGLGTLQVMACAFAISALTYWLGGQNREAAIIIGFGLALSSTAFALQILEERGEMAREHGKIGFSILLFQDLAIVPLLALVPFLAPFSSDDGSRPLWQQIGIAVAALAALILAGRYLLNPLFRVLANAGAREIMTAAALLVVIGSAVLMDYAGMSQALGAFVAGVLLAESAFRHQLEADIEPFRGLLLGLFFMAVGMSIDPAVVAKNWQMILLAVPVLLLVKAVIIYTACRIFQKPHAESVRVALLLPQGGEFAFVLFSAAAAYYILPRETVSILTAVVTVTMALTPLMVALARFMIPDSGKEKMEEDFDDVSHGSVLFISFGRFGQVVAQALLLEGVEVTILDNDPERIRAASNFGFRIFYGDGRRLAVLRAAGAEKAEVIAVCVDHPEEANQIVDLVQSQFPHAKLYVRAYDRAHSLELLERNVDFQIRETFESALMLGEAMLEGLGRSHEHARRVIEEVRVRDRQRLSIQQADGLYAGNHLMPRQDIRPEPLKEPAAPGKALNEEAKAVAENE